MSSVEKKKSLMSEKRKSRILKRVIELQKEDAESAKANLEEMKTKQKESMGALADSAKNESMAAAGAPVPKKVDIEKGSGGAAHPSALPPAPRPPAAVKAQVSSNTSVAASVAADVSGGGNHVGGVAARHDVQDSPWSFFGGYGGGGGAHTGSVGFSFRF